MYDHSTAWHHRPHGAPPSPLESGSIPLSHLVHVRPCRIGSGGGGGTRRVLAKVSVWRFSQPHIKITWPWLPSSSSSSPSIDRACVIQIRAVRGERQRGGTGRARPRVDDPSPRCWHHHDPFCSALQEFRAFGRWGSRGRLSQGAIAGAPIHAHGMSRCCVDVETSMSSDVGTRP